MRFAGSYVQLARALEISRSGLKRFAAMPNHPEPRSDRRHDVKAWAKFVSANATRIESTKIIPLKDQKRVELMGWQIAHKSLKLDKERNTLLAECGTSVEKWLETLRGRLDRLAKFELPPVLHLHTATKSRR
jgi:hypothetical protein